MQKNKDFFRGEILNVIPDGENFHVLIKVIAGDPYAVDFFQPINSTVKWRIVARPFPSLKLMKENKVLVLIFSESVDFIPKKGGVIVG